MSMPSVIKICPEDVEFRDIERRTDRQTFKIDGTAGTFYAFTLTFNLSAPLRRVSIA
jgi:hypothetical protein